MLPTPVERRDLLQRLLQIQLRLLGLFAQDLDRPTGFLAEEGEELVEELVLGHARHTLERSFFRFRFRVLCVTRRQRAMTVGVK